MAFNGTDPETADNASQASTIHVKSDNRPKEYRLFPSARLLAIFMVFLGQIFGNIGFSLLNFTIVCMVNSTAISSDPNLTHGHSTNDDVRVIGDQSKGQPENQYFGDIVWTRKQQGNVLAGYSWGILFLTIPAGMIMDRIGVKLIFGLGQVISVATLLLSPMAAYAGEWWLFVLRFFAGISGGFCGPVIMVSCNRWSPKKETGLLIAFCCCGFPIGALSGRLSASYFCAMGPLAWEYAFYLWGGLNALYLIAFMLLYTDDPRKSRWISNKELYFILEERKSNTASTEDGSCWVLPWRHLLTSMPVIATFVANFTASWVYYFIAIFQPTYIKEVLHYDPENNGIFSAIPGLAIFIGRLAFGHLSDRIRINKTLSVKLFECTSLVFAGSSFILLTFLNERTAPLAVAAFGACALFYSMNSGGFVKSTALIAPAYIGAISGIGETFAGAASLLVPYVVDFVAINAAGQNKWNEMFYISAGVAFAGTVSFLLFGSGKEQTWALKQQQAGDVEKDLPVPGTDEKTVNADIPTERIG